MLSVVIAQSPRDDLEVLGYMILYFVRGSLPWQGLKASTREQKHRLVLEQKQTIGMAKFCEGLPQDFETHMNYVRKLGYQDKPDYAYLRRIFRNLFYQRKFEYDRVFDWTILEYQRQAVDSVEKVVAMDSAGEASKGKAAQVI